MNLGVALVMFLIGVVLVVKGGDWFVDAATWIAKAANIPTFIIGATIVSFATTMPEMIVSVMASLEGKNDMAVGNAIGSVTANTGLIMAIAMICMTIIAPRKQYMKQCLLLIASAGILWIGSLTGTMASWANIALIAIFIAFMVLNVMVGKRESNEVSEEETIEKDQKTIVVNIIKFIGGAACIVLGSNLLINGGSEIAVALHVPERVIAVTMVAIGTSLPELVTTLTAISKKQSHLSIGNIIGANIIDLSLILPVCSFAAKESFVISPTSLALDFPACMLVTLIATLPLLLKERGYKAQGVVMLAAYIGYLILSI